MNDELIKRIGDNYLPANHKDGDTFLHTDYNEFLSIFKTAINENYFDIQKIINGSIKVSESSKLNGASLSQSVNGILSSDDNTVPSSKQVKEYIDDQYEDLQSKNDVLSETVSNNTESIKVFNDSVTELKDSKADVSETGSSIEILLNNENYIITVRLLDKTGKELSTSNIDLPLESVVVGAEYIDGTKTIRLSLKNGEYIDVPISSLVSGLVNNDEFNREIEELNSKLNEKLSSIPIASDSVLGGVRPVQKSSNMVSPVGVDDEGRLFSITGGGSSGGENGVTFVPSVSEDGIISWSNDGGLENPESVNIKGPQGIRGIQGENGITPNISIGTVTTLDPNEQATVTKTGTDEEPIFNFGIPKGEKGDIGPANTLTIGSVTTGDNASASITGQSPNQTLNLVLPKSSNLIAEKKLEENTDISSTSGIVIDGFTINEGESFDVFIAGVMISNRSQIILTLNDSNPLSNRQLKTGIINSDGTISSSRLGSIILGGTGDFYIKGSYTFVNGVVYGSTEFSVIPQENNGSVFSINPTSWVVSDVITKLSILEMLGNGTTLREGTILKIYKK